MTRRSPLPRTLTGRRTALGAAATAVALGAGLAVLLPQDDAPASPPVDATIVELDDSYAGKAALEALGGSDGKDLAVVAEAYDRTPEDLARSLKGDPTLNVDKGGRLYYADDFDGLLDEHAGHDHTQARSEPTPKAGGNTSTATDGAPAAQGYTGVGATPPYLGEGEDRGPHAPLSETWRLDSKPDAPKTLYLNFHAHRFHAASWWTKLANQRIPGWDPSGDGPEFNQQELAAVQEIWARVAEDYAAFDVNVTTNATVERLYWTSSADPTHGQMAFIGDFTHSEFQSGVLDPSLGGGSGTVGLAHLDNFGGRSQDGRGPNSPALIFGRGPAFMNDPDAGAWVVSHEIGHLLSLGHTFEQSVDPAPQGADSSALHSRTMDYVRTGPLSVFSLKERREMFQRLPARRDEGGASQAQARPLGRGGLATGYLGIDTTAPEAGDQDWFVLDGCLDLDASATVADLTPGLDVSLELRDASGSLLQSAAPETTVGTRVRNGGVDARLTASLEGEQHFLVVRSSGSAHYPASHVAGGYTLSVSGCDVEATAPSAPTQLTASTSPEGTTTVTWSPPVATGGRPLLGYDVILPDRSPVRVPESQTAWSTTTTPDESVRVRVRAVTSVGASAVAEVRSTLRPTAPLHLGVLNKNGQAVVTLVERPGHGATSGQMHIAGANAYYTLSTINSQVSFPTSSTFPWTPGTSGRLVLTNAAGSHSAAYTVRSAITAPGAPSQVEASLHGTAAALTWDVPTDDGGAFSSYEVRLDSSSWTAVSGYTFERLFAGLAAGEHQLSVRATNSAGVGPAVTRTVVVESEPTTPSAVTDVEVDVEVLPSPTDPTDPAEPETPTLAQATLRWEPPASDGQAPVRAWELTLGGRTTTLSSLRRSVTLVGLRTGSHAITLAPVNDVGVGTPVTRTIRVQ